jgi:putative membrane protein
MEGSMVRNIIFTGLIGLILIFVLQNTQVVEVRFLFWTVSMSRALILIGTLAIGLIGGWLLTLPKRRKALKEKAKN